MHAIDDGRRSGIIVPIWLPPELEQVRMREVASARAGAPAHVTLLFPFVPAAELQAADIERAAAAIENVRAFDIVLREVRRWDPGGGAPEGVIWLDPEPSEPFVELTLALARAFPDYQPYGGIHDTIVPHLTIASDDRAHLRAVQAEADGSLPLRRRVSSAALIVEGADGRWRTRRRLPLGAP